MSQYAPHRNILPGQQASIQVEQISEAISKKTLSSKAYRKTIVSSLHFHPESLYSEGSQRTLRDFQVSSTDTFDVRCELRNEALNSVGGG